MGKEITVPFARSVIEPVPVMAEEMPAHEQHAIFGARRRRMVEPPPARVAGGRARALADAVVEVSLRRDTKSLRHALKHRQVYRSDPPSPRDPARCSTSGGAG